MKEAKAPDRAPEAPVPQGILANLRYDAPAGLVVFLVAVPLCLGIAVASGAPPISGIIAGICGGLVVPIVSRAELSVSGPAAGLTAVVLAALATLGSFPVFCVAVALAGVMQMGLGALRAGRLSAYVPSSVVQGMLSAIGILIILKQLPHAVGFDKEAFGAEAFVSGGVTTFERLQQAVTAIEPAAVLVSVVGLVLLVLWEKTRLRKLNWMPGPLAAVIAGTVLHEVIGRFSPSLTLSQQHLVDLPPDGLGSALRMPELTALARADVWMVAVTIAVIASLETLLCIEAVDKLDPMARRSPTNRELVAQGLGNTVCGLLGGLPITSVIVRSSANVNAGARTKLSAMVHGLLLVLAVSLAAGLLEKIPLAALAAVLIATGCKLAKPSIFQRLWRLGPAQFVPAAATVAGVVLTDLLRGVAIGLVVSLVFAIRLTSERVVQTVEEGGGYVLRLGSVVPFWARGRVLALLDSLPERSSVIIDAEGASFVDQDVTEAVKNFAEIAARRNIAFETRGL